MAALHCTRFSRRGCGRSLDDCNESKTAFLYLLEFCLLLCFEQVDSNSEMSSVPFRNSRFEVGGWTLERSAGTTGGSSYWPMDQRKRGIFAIRNLHVPGFFGFATNSNSRFAGVTGAMRLRPHTWFLWHLDTDYFDFFLLFNGVAIAFAQIHFFRRILGRALKDEQRSGRS